MTRFLLIVFTLFSWAVNAQHPFYLTGRPLSVERNNALMVTGSQWHVEFIYVNSIMLEEKGISYYQKSNDSISKLLGEKTGYGTDWLSKLYAAADSEEKFQQTIRERVKNEQSFQEISSHLFEPFILFDLKNKRSKNYIIYVEGQLKTDVSRKFQTVLIYKYKGKSQRLKVKSKKVKTLKISIPQNGIK